MTELDKQALRRLVDAVPALPWRFEQMHVSKFGIRDDHGYIAFLETRSPVNYGSDPDREARARFLGAMTPDTVRALLDEIERIDGCCKAMAVDMGKLTRERNTFASRAEKLKDENEQLRALPQDWLAADLVKQLVDRAQAIGGSADGEIHDFAIVLLASAERLTRQEAVIDRLRAESEALRKDKDRLDALESNFWDVRHSSHPIADTGDSSSSLEIVGHWMDEPRERVIGENYNEDLRAALDQAMKAPAYPPARPEYEFDEFPNFGGGSGNKARRRAESLGIDYDAAMSKGEQANG